MTTEYFLIDTSVWLEVLPPERKANALRQQVDALLAADQVATTGMVRLELLGGARTTAEQSRLASLLAALHLLPIGEGLWNEAASLGFSLRRQGVVVPFTDLLIATVAIAHGASLLHRDRHFDLIAAHSSLKLAGPTH